MSLSTRPTGLEGRSHSLQRDMTLFSGDVCCLLGPAGYFLIEKTPGTACLLLRPIGYTLRYAVKG